MKLNLKIKNLLPFIALIITPIQAQAKIHHCIINGISTYSDQPCEASDSPVGNPLKPHWYIDMPSQAVADAFSISMSDQGFMKVENESYITSFESNAEQIVTFAQVKFKSMPCTQSQRYNIRELLTLFGLNANRLSHIKGTANYANSFNDHDNKLKITFLCPYDGALYSASFSKRYYQKN
ncbi:hypothetical protein [Pseudoalteromonas ulvae]|uniref:DUF4124 domain-containing protein n=1 Tax=Pseudoalteromonas ulvae TaxID=107327 RepID=A0A244CUF6_PSEDV|nr:hypothetical protein [Pseudoalteromonas ulvae]OUL59235.1 hypothetical protein B1199_02920 [Pseudoalteromonas ulvae]